MRRHTDTQSSYGDHVLQVVGKVNVEFRSGKGRPSEEDKGKAHLLSECLVNVYAQDPIKKGDELLATYGANFWR
jgi:hypothetical protein